MHKLMDDPEFKKLALETRDRLDARQRKKALIPACFSEGRRWHCVHTNQWCEMQAEKEIGALGLATYLPKEVRWDRHKGRRGHKRGDKVARPLIPRYLFVLVEATVLIDARDAIEGCRGVDEVICYRDALGVPARIPHEVVAKLRAREEAGEFDETLAQEEACPFVLGETVRIGDGVFMGLNVEFRQMRPARRAELWMGMLGAVVPVELPLAWLEKL